MNIEILAGIIAKHTAETFGLDFSVQSMETVDSVLNEVNDWSKAGKNMLVISLGCYIGEILVRETDGRWCAEEDYAGPLWKTWVEIPSESGTITADPFVRCRKRIKNGKADGVAVWVKVIIAMANNPAIMAEAV